MLFFLSTYNETFDLIICKYKNATEGYQFRKNVDYCWQRCDKDILVVIIKNNSNSSNNNYIKSNNYDYRNNSNNNSNNNYEDENNNENNNNAECSKLA